MRFFRLISILCLGSLIATGQTSSSQSATPNPDAPAQKPAAALAKPLSAKLKATESKEVGPDTAVVTIKGLCSAPKAASSKTAGAARTLNPATCETVVTRKQLELLIDAVRPNLPPTQRRMVAQQYAELLIMANAAARAGVEKDPKVQEQLRLSKLQTLASSYSREIQQKEADVPPADIEKYYKENAAKYEQAKLQRIYVPAIATEDGKPPDAALTKLLAQNLQQRAAAGEDFDKLEKEAYAAANNKGTPPSVDMGERRRSTLPAKQADTVFGLKAGEVSPPLEEASGFSIYKVLSKDKVPLDKVRDEIKATLGRERFRETIEKVRNSVKPTYNEAYFGSGTPPATAGAPTMAPGPSSPAPPTAGTPAPPAASSPQTPAAAQPPSATPAPATASGTPETPQPSPPASPQSK